MQFIDKYFWVFSTFLVPTLYILVATAFYLLMYTWKNKEWASHKIQPENLTTTQLKRELLYSTISLGIFAGTGFLVYGLYKNGLTQLYLNPAHFGFPYLFVSVLLMIFFHDMYFYWTHRLLHFPGLYRSIHRVHHLSTNSSPFTSLSFHPVEAIIQAAVLPLMVVIIPAHPYALFVFLFYMVYKNVRGHAGFEFTTAATRNAKRNFLHSYSIHHNIHHAHGRANYGLYFTLWDRLMKTFRKE